MQDVARESQGYRLGATQLRNDSILAHGTSPLAREQFTQFRDWFGQSVLPAFVRRSTLFDGSQVTKIDGVIQGGSGMSGGADVR